MVRALVPLVVLVVAAVIVYAAVVVRRIRGAQARISALEADLQALRTEATRLAEEAAVLTALLSEKGVADEEDFAEARRRHAGSESSRPASGRGASDGEKDTLH